MSCPVDSEGEGRAGAAYVGGGRTGHIERIPHAYTDYCLLDQNRMEMSQLRKVGRCHRLPVEIPHGAESLVSWCGQYHNGPHAAVCPVLLDEPAL